jgi:hypothetical protein
MKEFISMREFLLLEKTRGEGKFFTQSSWESHGDEGPPPGSRVVSLVSGYGGGPGVGLAVIKLVDDTENYAEEYVDKYLLLARSDGSECLLEREYWWRDVRPA